MRYLLDTNVISETRRPRMNEKVQAFLNETDAGKLYLSVLTLGELRKGIAIRRQTDPVMADSLNAWVDELEHGFADRIINIDVKVAQLWGELSSDRSRPVIDTLIGATALAHDLVLVTCNTKDIAGSNVTTLDPFAG